MEVSTDLTAVVDEYAAVKAAIATLEEKEESLKAMLIAAGEKSIKGTQHKVGISWVCPKPATDYKGICDYLKVGAETLALFAVEKSPYVVCRVYGR